MKKVDIGRVYKILKKEAPKYNVPVVDLVQIQTEDPFKVLIATMLSARTKDATTANACERLFFKIKNIEDINGLTARQIEKIIFPVGFYKTKAKHLKKLPLIIKKEFGGKIPETIDELIKIDGVGRKTANLVIAVAFKKPAVCVDTHVHRIMNRLGYVKTKTPFETEMVLRKKLSVKYWEKVNSLMVAFGQEICNPVSPRCSICPIIKYCNRLGVAKSR